MGKKLVDRKSGDFQNPQARPRVEPTKPYQQSEQWTMDRDKTWSRAIHGPGTLVPPLSFFRPYSLLNLNPPSMGMEET